MNKENLKQNLIKYSYEHKLTHIGSNLTAVDIIDEIYQTKKPWEKFVLSSGHAHLAHAVVKQKYGEGEVWQMLNAGIHCDKANGCDISTGSLGQGLPIALGMAIADKEVDVYCLISDGECAEGSVWETLRVKSELHVDNLKVYVNSNGYGAYGEIDQGVLETRLKTFCPDIQFRRTKVDGLQDHYRQVTDKEYGKTQGK
jgi:transketolase